MLRAGNDVLIPKAGSLDRIGQQDIVAVDPIEGPVCFRTPVPDQFDGLRTGDSYEASGGRWCEAICRFEGEGF